LQGQHVGRFRSSSLFPEGGILSEVSTLSLFHPGLEKIFLRSLLEALNRLTLFLLFNSPNIEVSHTGGGSGKGRVASTYTSCVYLTEEKKKRETRGQNVTLKI
jgi:hypothetical protein